MIRPALSGARNGLPEPRRWYVYRGTGKDTLTPHLDRPGRRRLEDGCCPDCAYGVLDADGRCAECG